MRKLHDNGETCRIGFVRSSEYGEINLCIALLAGHKGHFVEMYAASKERAKRSLNYKNRGMGLIKIIK